MDTEATIKCIEPTCDKKFKTISAMGRHSTTAHRLTSKGEAWVPPHEAILARHAEPEPANKPIAGSTRRKKRGTSQKIKIRHVEITDTEAMAGFMTMIEGKKVPMTPKNLNLMAEIVETNKKLLQRLTL